MVFIDLEKIYDRVPRDVLWWALMKKGISLRYIDLIKDMYDGAITNVRTSGGLSDSFPITIGLHQGSALSPFLFAIVMDELTKNIQDEVPWCMLFADDIVLVDETKDGINSKLELWRDTLESRGFRLSRSKTEYMKCKFSDTSWDDGETIKLDGQDIPRSEHFRYLGSIIQCDGNIDRDVTHRIQAGWLKWRSASGVLCDRTMPLHLKGRFYRTAVRPALLYGTECWAIKKQQEHKMAVAEMRMLRWMSGKTRSDRIRNEEIRNKLGVCAIEDKMRECRLRWFGHVQRRPEDAPVRRSDMLDVGELIRGRGRPLKTWRQVIQKDMSIIGLDEKTVLDRNEWHQSIHTVERI